MFFFDRNDEYGPITHENRLSWEKFHVLGEKGVNTLTAQSLKEDNFAWKVDFHDQVIEPANDRLASQFFLHCEKSKKKCTLYVSLMSYKDIGPDGINWDGKGFRIQMHRHYYAGYEAIIKSRWITKEATPTIWKTTEFKPEDGSKTPFYIKCDYYPNRAPECYVSFENSEPPPKS